MVYAAFESEYKSAYESLKGICDRVGSSDFFPTSKRTGMNAKIDGAKLPHFKNHTNNRLESFFGKLKDGIDGSMSMAACIKALVAYDRRVQNEYQYRAARIGQFVNSSYDEEMSSVLRFTTHFVAEQIEDQYAKALSKFEFTLLELRLPFRDVDEASVSPCYRLQEARERSRASHSNGKFPNS
ncbi:hypothetical protein PHMEG_00030435 [Phytophthora megakarya]|uniref:Uncharacterized protein n=1 Tax=Phytophthora megakarya TaxID=4795 RepID=A0A225V2V4_9STRA|nr:hypothetical protein PHMEG_00030435 [Phytophthora megakarya]